MRPVRESLRQGGALEALGAGCVLTGGGAMRCPGLLDVTESHKLRVPARIGCTCASIPTCPANWLCPSFAVATTGLLLYAHRTRINRAAESNSLRAKLRAIFASSF